MYNIKLLYIASVINCQIWGSPLLYCDGSMIICLIGLTVLLNATINTLHALGPLLLLYINTLPSRISEALLLQFADDTTIVCSRPNPVATASVIA